MNILQTEILNIFKEIDKVCIKHNLRYYAIGGTCLGAVRHQGFIPWDDDLDIAMPRDDYEKFKKIAEDELPDHLKVFPELAGEHNVLKFIKVHNVNTTFVEKIVKDYTDKYIGVFVDIMPLDGIPSNTFEKKLYYGILHQLSRLDWNRKFYKETQQREDSNLKKTIWRILYYFEKKLPSNYFAELYIKLQKKYSYNDTKELAYTWHPEKKIIFSKGAFEDYVLLPFENYQMRCPVGYDEFLTALFGDYMKLPPKEQQVPCHETDIFDLERPYSYYIEQNKRNSETAFKEV